MAEIKFWETNGIRVTSTEIDNIGEQFTKPYFDTLFDLFNGINLAPLSQVIFIEGVKIGDHNQT